MASAFKKVAETERNHRATLYFGNLDSQVTEVLMYELFIQFAPIRSLNMPKDRVLKTHQGFGFVEFRSVEDADYVMDILRGIRLYGKTLKLKKTDLLKSGKGTSEQTGLSIVDVGAKLFINNLNPLIDESFLQDTFSKFGTLIKPPAIQRDDDGKSKGYAFLTFDDFTTSDYVIEKMDGKTLMNSKVNIAYAYKEDASGHQQKVRHGDKVERLLAENAKSNNLLPKPKKRGRR
ncbi:RNA-binding domain-containing protein [Suhomyces tanzawaensis NRRL Y-17324]|uniref:RNA-binding domain-containing protein n=1 Tax=Suhomyces tanzawaensis NRRL Y-17324 TaxID=984487 RepID=A0A1E4SL06_9ASCO|nr:RNA-binding domain-containing protein [Suhomyces tanzawaensis NRRL Y-17324]ODV80184.1 RNA-binding domain-containing protein [Suhomyces tanzawaensis NRRL Y-17324]